MVRLVVKRRGPSLRCSALLGRTFGDILDEIAPGWRAFGFLDGDYAAPGTYGGYPGSEEEEQAKAETRRKAALIVDALCEGTIELADIDGAAVPRWVWFSGRWWFHCNGKRECLEAQTVAGQKIEYYTREVREPTAEGDDKKPARSGKKRGGGNTGYDDTAVVELVRDELKKMAKPAKSVAAKTVIDRLIAEGRPVASNSTPAQWAARIARKL